MSSEEINKLYQLKQIYIDNTKLYQLKKRIYIGNIKLDEIKKILSDIILDGHENDIIDLMINILNNSETNEEQKMNVIKKCIRKCLPCIFIPYISWPEMFVYNMYICSKIYFILNYEWKIYDISLFMLYFLYMIMHINIPYIKSIIIFIYSIVYDIVKSQIIKIFKEFKNQQINLGYIETFIMETIKNMSYKINHSCDIICCICTWIIVFTTPFFIILHSYNWLIIIICIVLHSKFIRKYTIISSFILIDLIYIYNILISSI